MMVPGVKQCTDHESTSQRYGTGKAESRTATIDSPSQSRRLAHVWCHFGSASALSSRGPSFLTFLYTLPLPVAPSDSAQHKVATSSLSYHGGKGKSRPAWIIEILRYVCSCLYGLLPGYPLRCFQTFSLPLLHVVEEETSHANMENLKELALDGPSKYWSEAPTSRRRKATLAGSPDRGEESNNGKQPAMASQRKRVERGRGGGNGHDGNAELSIWEGCQDTMKSMLQLVARMEEGKKEILLMEAGFKEREILGGESHPLNISQRHANTYPQTRPPSSKSTPSHPYKENKSSSQNRSSQPAKQATHPS